MSMPQTPTDTNPWPTPPVPSQLSDTIGFRSPVSISYLISISPTNFTYSFITPRFRYGTEQVLYRIPRNPQLLQIQIIPDLLSSSHVHNILESDPQTLLQYINCRITCTYLSSNINLVQPNNSRSHSWPSKPYSKPYPYLYIRGF